MENEKVENKKAKNKEALRDLRKFTFDSAVKYFNAETEQERAAVLADVHNVLSAEGGQELSAEEIGLIINAFSSMGNAAGLSKKEVKQEVNETMHDLSRIGLYDKELYNDAAAKPEEKVKWRAADAVVDRCRLADLNLNRTSNGLGIALDKIVLGAESAGVSAKLGARRVARSTSEALRGAANGFAAACSATRTKLAGTLQNRVMKHNVRINHDNAIITKYYEKATIARLEDAIKKEDNEAELAKLNTLLEYAKREVVVETPYTALIHENGLRFANMYLDGDPRAQNVTSDFIKFNAANKDNFTKAVQRKMAYAVAKQARAEEFDKVLGAYDDKRGVLKAKQLASKVYHARRSELKGQDLAAGNMNAAEYRSGVNDTELKQEYKRTVDRTIRVNGSGLGSKIKAFFFGTPSKEREEAPEEAKTSEEVAKKEGILARYRAKRAQKKAERKMAKEKSKEASEMETTTITPEEKKSSEKKTLRDRFFAWRSARAEKRAKKAEKRGNEKKAQNIREAQAKREERRAKKVAEKAQRRAEKQARKNKTADTTAVAPVETKTAESKKKASFWARHIEKKAQKAEARGNTKAAEEIRAKYAKKLELRQGKKEARAIRNAKIRAIKEEAKKSVNATLENASRKIREAKEEYRQKVASLRNDYRSIPAHWRVANLNKPEVKSEKKPGLWARFKAWIKREKAAPVVAPVPTSEETVEPVVEEPKKETEETPAPVVDEEKKGEEAAKDAATPGTPVPADEQKKETEGTPAPVADEEVADDTATPGTPAPAEEKAEEEKTDETTAIVVPEVRFEEIKKECGDIHEDNKIVQEILDHYGVKNSEELQEKADDCKARAKKVKEAVDSNNGKVAEQTEDGRTM